MWTLTEAQICGKRVRPRRLPRPRRFPARLGDGVAPRWGRRSSRSRGTSLRPVGRRRAPPAPPIPGPPLRPQRLECRGVSAHGDDSCDVGSRVGRLWQGQLQESLRDQERVSPASGPAAPPGRDAESVPLFVSSSAYSEGRRLQTSAYLRGSVSPSR